MHRVRICLVLVDSATFPKCLAQFTLLLARYEFWLLHSLTMLDIIRLFNFSYSSSYLLVSFSLLTLYYETIQAYGNI